MEVVYWDLETTGLDAVNKHVDIEILEIGAISETGLKFQQYLLPSAPIPRDSSKVHGIYLKKKPGRRAEKRGYDMTKLYFKKEGGRMVQVNAVDKKTGLKMFLDWLKGFDKKILLAGYNNHNFDDWVLAHNLLQVDLDVSELGVQFGDVAKVVRPLLNKEFDTKKWKLGFAVDCLLKRDQSLAHGALSDAEDARDLLMKIAEKKEVDTKDILEETMGESNERLRALKDFDEVMKVCVGMFMNSGAGMARSVTREGRMKDKWKKFADKKKMVKEQQLVEKKGKKAKSPKKTSPSNEVERKKMCPKPLKCTEEGINVEKFKSNLQKENIESVKVVAERNVIPDKPSVEAAEKNKLKNVVEEAKVHKSGLIMASDLPKRVPSVSSNKITTTLRQTKYQQTKLNFGTAPKTITSQTSSTKLTTASAKVVGASSDKITRASLTQRTDSSVNKAAVVSSNKLSGGQCAKTKVEHNRKINENKNSNTPRLPPKQQQQQHGLSTKNITKKLSESYHDSELDIQAAQNKLNIPDLECSIPLDEWDQSFQLDKSCQDGPKEELDRWDQSCQDGPKEELDRWDQSCQDGPKQELDRWHQSCQGVPKQQQLDSWDQSCQDDPITELEE